MSEKINPADFNPDRTSEGFALFEHWETNEWGGHELLLVASTPQGIEMKPGDFILHRHWAPASTPMVYNRARGGEE